MRGDMLAIYKYLNGDASIREKLFSLRVCKRTRGHTMRLEEKRFNLKLGRGFFTVRVIRTWNSLPQLVVSEGSIDIFKRLLDVHLDEQNIQGYGK